MIPCTRAKARRTREGILIPARIIVATIASTLTPARPPKHKAVVKNCLRSAYSHVQRSARCVQGLQLSHRGAYSIERLNAFDEYCRTTSRLRIIGVCLAIPLPSLMVAIGIECVPLQDPAKGWRANHGAFIRDALVFFLTCFGVCIQTRQLTPILSLSMERIVLISAATTTFSLSLRILIAETWTYPIPFGYALGTIPHGTAFSLCFIAGVGRKQLREKPELLVELWNQAIVIVSLVSLCLVYPAYNAVYLRLNSWQQTLFVFVLPFLKLVLKNVLAWSTKHIVEFMPGVIAFSVEVFNALYVAKCMQSADSITTFVAIMGLDAVKAMITFQSMKDRARKIHQLMVHCSSGGFIATVLNLCHAPGVLSREGSLICIRSPITIARSKTSIIRLDELTRQKLSALTSGFAEEPTAPEPFRSLKSFQEINKEGVRRTKSSPAWTITSDVESISKANPLKAESIDMHQRRKSSLNSVEPAGVTQEASIGFDPDGFSHQQSLVSRELPPRSNPIRTRKVLPAHHDSIQSSAPVDAVSDQNTDADTNLTEGNTMTPIILSFHRSVVVHPWDLHRHDTDPLEPRETLPEDRSAFVYAARLLSSHEKHEIVDQSLRLLFQCEYHALVKYVEAMIPMFYCIYVGVLSHLPSRKYYPEMRHMTTDEMENTIIHIIAYAGLEIVSFCVMHFLMKWRCGFSPLYLLAFVLEHQATEFLARLLIWFSFVLQFTLVHNGVDLSAKFAWLKGDWGSM